MSLGNRAADMMLEAALSEMDEYTRRKNGGYGEIGNYRTPPWRCLVCEEWARPTNVHLGPYASVCAGCSRNPKPLELFQAVANGRIPPSAAVHILQWKPLPWWTRLALWWRAPSKPSQSEWPDDMFERAEDKRRELRLGKVKK